MLNTQAKVKLLPKNKSKPTKYEIPYLKRFTFL